MTVGMLIEKRDQLAQAPLPWLQPKHTFTLRDAATLLGQLENHTRYVRWARIWMAPLYNAFRDLFLAAYGAMSRRWNSSPKLRAKYNAMHHGLPAALKFRLNGIIAQDKASFLWRTNQRATVSPGLRRSLHLLLKYLRSDQAPWTEYIGFIIRRDHHFRGWGDASGVAGGAYFPLLRLWFQVIWDPATRARATASMKDPTRLQINCLEFVVVILQLAAVITWMQEAPATDVEAVFPDGLPFLPILATGSDNQVSKGWATKGFTNSIEGQHLLMLYSDILRAHRIRQNVFFKPGKENVVPDDISRPTNSTSDPILSSPPSLYLQISQKHPFLRTYTAFQPDRILLQRITSALYTTSALEPREIPKKLGRLVPAGSTGSTFVMA